MKKQRQWLAAVLATTLLAGVAGGGDSGRSTGGDSGRDTCRSA